MDTRSMRHQGAVSRPHARNSHGAAAVEFALVVPVLLLLMLGLIQYGFYFRSVQGGSAAAHEGARRAAVDDYPTCDGPTGFKSYVLGQIGSSSSPSATATVTRTYLDGTTPVSHSGIAIGDTVVVTVTFKTVDMHIPFLPFVPNAQVTQSAAERLENISDPSQPPEIC